MKSSRRGAFLLLSLFALGCDPQPRVIADGWHSGRNVQDERAEHDSSLGLSRREVPIAYLGVEDVSMRTPSGERNSAEIWGENWASSLLELHPSVVVGHPGSTATNSAARLYADAGVPLIAPNATARSAPDVERWVFRLLPDDATQGSFLASYALDSVRARRVAVVYVGDVYGVGVLRGARVALARRGLPLGDETELPSAPCLADRMSAARLATRAMLARVNPEAVIMAVPLEAAYCVIEEVSAARSTAVLLGADVMDDVAVDNWVRLHAPSAPLRIVTGWQPKSDTITLRFIESVARRTGLHPSGSDALHQDALALAAEAIVQTDGSPAAVREWLASLGVSRTPFTGLTGEITFVEGRKVRLAMRTITWVGP